MAKILPKSAAHERGRCCDILRPISYHNWAWPEARSSL